MGSNWFEVPPTGYLASIGGGQCQLLVGPNVDETWLVGAAFLNSYYSIWDHSGAGGRIGLVPHVTSAASTVTIASSALPTTVFTPFSLWNTFVKITEITSIVVGTLGVAGAVALVVFVLLYQFKIIQTPFTDLESMNLIAEELLL
jgi:hypothetical protein